MGETLDRDRLADELSKLKEVAGLSLVQIEQQGQRQRPPVNLGKSKVSSWLKGTNVPSAEVSFHRLIEILEPRAHKRAGISPKGLAWWLALRQAAADERSSATKPKPVNRQSRLPAPAREPAAAPHAGDADKAIRLLRLLPLDGYWYRWLTDAETMFKVPLTVSDPVCDAHRPLETDPLDYIDPELQNAHHDFVAALGALCHELNGMTDISDEGPEVLDISYPGTRAERNELNRQACQARDQFLAKYTKVINVLNAKGLIPPTPKDPLGIAVELLGVRAVPGGAAALSDSSAAPHETLGTTVEPSFAVQDGYETVRSQASGDPRAYRRCQFRLPGSNQADVFEATHKKTGLIVAVKQLHGKNPRELRVARMKREIEAGRALTGHPHAMPILDHGADHTWFVMPWANGTAEDHKEVLRDSEPLHDLVYALTSVLTTAHRLGWIHRDIKPANILRFNGQWVLADWGAVRRPPGQTTKVGRTVFGIGTEGFSAPEVMAGQVRPDASGDVYSVGRVIAWALTGEMPVINKQLLPDPGPWRSIVRSATQDEPSRRPQTISELAALIEREHSEIPVDPLERATTLLEQANSGHTDAADALLTLLTDHTGDYDLHVGSLTELTAHQAGPALARNPAQAKSVLKALTEHVHGDGTRRVQFAEASRVTIWLHGIAAHAAAERQWDLLEEAVQAMCTWDGFWDQWDARDRISPWLASLKGDAAAAVAAVLRDYPDSARHFSHLAEDGTNDPRIRQAVRQA
ncbi:serine/threonine protein kinase [Streptomyces scopuliridis]|uniref:protein kinase domain-containing protein n=1 Tax=Streptomyces scopuliridis TaxID=452529 RepID=UPI00367D0181